MEASTLEDAKSLVFPDQSCGWEFVTESTAHIAHKKFNIHWKKQCE